jgi:hypothetical protein
MRFREEKGYRQVPEQEDGAGDQGLLFRDGQICQGLGLLVVLRVDLFTHRFHLLFLLGRVP